MDTIPYSRQWVDQSDIDPLIEVLTSDYVTQGPQIKFFEEKLQQFFKVAHVIAVANGTAALHLTIQALGNNKNTTGITSPITFAASANCFLYNKSNVVFSDVNSETGLIDIIHLEQLLKKINTSGTIIPVSLQGRVPNLPRIYQLAKAKGWTVIEDAAHSFGATYLHEGELFKSASCLHSDAAILSFHPLKHICCGEGGAVLTNDDILAKKIRLIANHGIQRVFDKNHAMNTPWLYDQIDLGWNYRMTELQASLGISQLKKFPQFLAERKRRAQIYRDKLSTSPFNKVFKIFPEDPGHAYHIFVIHFLESSNRDKAYTFLKNKNILSQVHYRPIYDFKYYKKIFGLQKLQGAEAYSQSCLSIPLFPKMNDNEQSYVINTLEEFCCEL